MGRGRVKGKKQSPVAGGYDTASGEEEKLSVRRRGRPLKPPLKGDVEEVVDQVEKLDQDVSEETKNSVLSKNNKILPGAEIGRKRKRPLLVKENSDSLREENVETNSSEITKSVGYRHNASRRKGKPRRAAEVGVRAYEDIVAH